MKEGRSLHRAAAAALNEAIRDADRIAATLRAMRKDFGGAKDTEVKLDGQKMTSARELAARINQRVHEFSAYSNVVLTP